MVEKIREFVKTCQELDNRHDDKSSSTRALFPILGINWEWISHGFNWAPHPIFSIQRAFGTYILGNKVLLVLRNSLGHYTKSPHLITMTILVAKLQYFISVKTLFVESMT